MKMLTSRFQGVGLASALILVALGTFGPLNAADAVVATVNGQQITELDMELAETEIGRDLGQLPPVTKRRVLVEYLIENFLFANAAVENKLDSGPVFEPRMRYMRRRALRETYFEQKIRQSISDAAAEAFYKDRVKGLKPKDEVKARHILVKTEEEVRDMQERLARGADFAELAKKHSIDGGSKPNGGMLGYFSQGQMVPAFEQAAFSLKKGEVSEPVQSRFGWHLIKIEDRRVQPVPAFADVRVQILNTMVHQKTQAEANRLRGVAQIEYLDAAIKAEVAKQNKKADSQRQAFERRVQEMQKEKAQGQGQAAPAGSPPAGRPAPAPAP